MRSESIAKLAEALSKAQGEIKGAAKDTDNTFFKSRYADLASVWDACRASLSAHGLSVIQTTEDGADGVTVVTTLAHSSGEWVDGRLTLKPVKGDPQGVGSAITYARRYALAAIVGVAPEDDDGNAASGHTNGKAVKPEIVERPRPKHGQMQGPRTITALKADMRAFAHDLEGCADIDSLNGLVQDNKELLEQCERDLPDWYFGVEGGDVKGAQARIAERIAELTPDQPHRLLAAG